jgi:hypothetical protein
MQPAASALPIVIAMAAACTGATDPLPAGPLPVAGVWNYSGQVAGASAPLAGAMEFVSRSAINFSGSADIVEGVGSAQRRLTGPVSGRVTDGVVVDFDVTLGSVLRRHVARRVADTLTGSWFALSAGGAAIGTSGPFRAVRRP